MAATGSVLSLSASCARVATYVEYFAIWDTDRAHSVCATDHPAIYTIQLDSLLVLVACLWHSREDPPHTDPEGDAADSRQSACTHSTDGVTLAEKQHTNVKI